MKPLYGVPEAGNHLFATYHTHYKDKLGIINSIYDPCLFYSSSSFGIVGMQTNITLIFADNDFGSTEENVIRLAKIMTKDREHFISTHSLKFNGAQIKFDLNGIVLTKKSHIGDIFPITDYVADSTSSKGIIRKKLLSKEQYLAQRVRKAYIASVCQSEVSLDLS